MSILIKGLDIIPDEPTEFVVLPNMQVLRKGLHANYIVGTAVEITVPHGNLIDISEAKHMMDVRVVVEGKENAMAVVKLLNEAMDFLENYPAVVEREE